MNFSKLDYFTKVSNSNSITTTSGGIFTLAAYVIAVVLIISELNHHLTP